jgi:hypothetical protein
MVPQTERELSRLLEATIVAIVPRSTYHADKPWKPYNRSVSEPTTTRHFTLRWEAGDLEDPGASAGHIFEINALLIVRTDYAGEHYEQQFIINDDFHQVGDALFMAAAPDNSLVLVERVRTRPFKGDPQTDDVVQVDHVYKVRFMKRIRP